MKYTYLLCLLACILISYNLSSQTENTILDPSNQKIQPKIRVHDDEGFIWWKCDSLKKDSLFTELKPWTGLGADDEMDSIATWEDSITLLVHQKYQQNYKGLKLENVIYCTHSMNDFILQSNGYICEGMNQSNIPLLTENQAFLDVMTYYGTGTTFAWQVDSIENTLKEDSLAEDTTYLPQGELLWAYINSELAISPSDFTLAYKFRIWALNPDIQEYIYIDANNGAIIKTETFNKHGTFNHSYYGTKSIDTRWYGGFKQKYFLKTDDHGRNITTKEFKDQGKWAWRHLPDDKDDNWGTDNNHATLSHWAVQNSWDFWSNIYKRHGVDNNWRPLKVIADHRDANMQPIFNAGYKIQSGGADHLYFGSFDLGPAASIDNAGHEYTHGVVNYTAKLPYEFEQGALDESYADIFGFMTERFVLGSGNWNWDIGEKATNLAQRSLSNPKSKTPFDPGSCLPSDYPTYYEELNSWAFVPFGCDYGGVHHNSSVQNFCFHLLSVGGSQLGLTVSGIGIDKAANIAQYALTNGNVVSLSNFHNNRAAWVNAAATLYGYCSFEHKQTCLAWAACNVGSPCNCDIYVTDDICWANRFRHLIDEPAKIIDLKKNIGVYPNPANEILNINFNELVLKEYNLFSRLSIHSILGKEIYSQRVSNKIETINIKSLTPGVYVLKVSGVKDFISYRFIKN